MFSYLLKNRYSHDIAHIICFLQVHVQLSASNIDSPDTSLQEEVPRTPVSTPGQLTIGSPKIQQPVSNTDNSSLQEEVPRTPVSTPGQLAIGSSKIQQPASNTDSPNSSLQEEVPRTPVRTLSQLGIGSPNTMGSPGGWIPQNTSTPITSPTCTWQNGAMGDSNRVQQNWTPVRPRTDLSWQTMPSFTALISSAEGNNYFLI